MKACMMVLMVSLTALLGSCDSNKAEKFNSPLATVVKMNAAESLMDFEEAEKYQDVDKIYSKFTKGDTVKPHDVWKEVVTSGNSMAAGKKFTNQLKYFNYDIAEKVNSLGAEVNLKAKSPGAEIQAIIYKLELRNAGWTVVDIEYKNK